jgi:hypothetical protein
MHHPRFVAALCPCLCLYLCLFWAPAALAAQPAPPPAAQVTILWPRIIPSADSAAQRARADVLQASLLQRLAKALPGQRAELRPEPERRCSHDRCERYTLGALLLHRGQGCAVVATIHQPHGGAVRLMPWAGKLRMKAYQIQAGERPEDFVTVEDFAPCAGLVEALAAGDADVEREIRAGAAPAKP